VKRDIMVAEPGTEGSDKKVGELGGKPSGMKLLRSRRKACYVGLQGERHMPSAYRTPETMAPLEVGTG
jgi:hypothetical protein